MSNLPDDLVEAAARELYGMDGAKHRLEDADPIVQANYREEARRHLDLEYATLLDGTTMPAPDVLPNQHCWCGGAVGARTPGDHLGLGCLNHVEHDWTTRPASKARTHMDNPPCVGAPKNWPWGYLPCGCCNDGYGGHVR